MMFISREQPIEIHAKALFEAFGFEASNHAIQHAKVLNKSGDIEGYLLWIEVAKKITSFTDDTAIEKLDNYDGIIMYI
jgi:hypothetical protein